MIINYTHKLSILFHLFIPMVNLELALTEFFTIIKNAEVGHLKKLYIYI